MTLVTLRPEGARNTWVAVMWACIPSHSKRSKRLSVNRQRVRFIDDAAKIQGDNEFLAEGILGGTNPLCRIVLPANCELRSDLKDDARTVGAAARGRAVKIAAYVKD